MDGIDVLAPAKVNLYLEVTGRDEEGFHLLETIFQTIDLHDRISLRSAKPGLAITVASGSGACPADPSNLAWRAAAAWHQACGRDPALHIGLEKHIPVAAGLGGGSSDAAAVLRGLQAWHDQPLSSSALHEVAADLGADVPFFLHGGCAYADRRGDRLQVVERPPALDLTILQPACSCPTPRVFAALRDEERCNPPLGPARLIERLRRDPAGLLFNRLAAAARRLHPEVDHLLTELAGRALPHCLSGSGSCCLVLGHIEAPPGCQAWHCHSLAQGEPDKRSR
jgi:4-diphosphocytidyl-2-C-methyl-D-erythritol kinase